MPIQEEIKFKEDKLAPVQSIEEDIVQASSDGNDEGYMESDEDVSIS